MQEIIRQPKISSESSASHRLKRGLSKTSENLPLVCKARDIVLQDIHEGTNDVSNGNSTSEKSRKSCRYTTLPHLIDTPVFTFVMPDLRNRGDVDFADFLHKDLVEMSALVSLEQAGRLNWWADVGACQRLLPLATTGDGNCLLHAASLGMWGFHDRKLILRSALSATLKADQENGAFYRRWRWRQTHINMQSGLILSEMEWQEEWTSICDQASSTPRLFSHMQTDNKGKSPPSPTLSADLSYESLEELHVFVLAHALRRPIVVVADTLLKTSDGEPLAPIPFGGLYLPLECDPQDCHRSPLLLTYDAAHFSALVAMDETENTEDASLPAAIPLIDPAISMLLPIHFDYDPGVHCQWSRVDQRCNVPIHSPYQQANDLLDCNPACHVASPYDSYSPYGQHYRDFAGDPDLHQSELSVGDRNGNSGEDNHEHSSNADTTSPQQIRLQDFKSLPQFPFVDSPDHAPSPNHAPDDSYAARRALISRYLQVEVLPALGGQSLPNNRRRHRRTPSAGSVTHNDLKAASKEDPVRAADASECSASAVNGGSRSAAISSGLKRRLHGSLTTFFRRKLSRKLRRRFAGKKSSASSADECTSSTAAIASTTSAAALTSCQDVEQDDPNLIDPVVDYALLVETKLSAATTANGVLCAMLVHRRLDYQEEIVKNYVECARRRYLDCQDGGARGGTRVRARAPTVVAPGSGTQLGRGPERPTGAGYCSYCSTSLVNELCTKCNIGNLESKCRTSELLNSTTSYDEKFPNLEPPPQRWSHDTCVVPTSSSSTTEGVVYDGRGNPPYSYYPNSSYNTTAVSPSRHQTRSLDKFGSTQYSSHTLPLQGCSNAASYTCSAGSRGNTASSTTRDPATTFTGSSGSFDDLQRCLSRRSKCRNSACDFYGTESSDFLCSICFKSRHVK